MIDLRLRPTNIRRQSGATLAEYAIAAGAMVVVLLTSDMLVEKFNEHFSEYLWAISLPF